MKIFHTSDWHLGRMLHGRSLLDDQRHFIYNEFIPKLKLEQPDLVIISGDIYDRKVTSAEAIALFDGFISDMLDLQIPIAITAGNHDSAERIAIGKPALRKAGIYVSTNLDDALVPVEIEKNGELLQVFLLPFLENAYVREYLGKSIDSSDLKTETECMKAVIEILRPSFKTGATKILSAHCFVAGSERSDSESTLFVGGSGAVASDIFSDFDYVALGHLHGAQKTANGRYSGSPLKYSVDEQKHNKSFVSLSLENKVLSHELIPIIPLRDVRRIEGYFDDLFDLGKKEICGDYVEITLLDKTPVTMAIDRLRPYYPYLLNLRNSFSAVAVTSERNQKLRGADEKTIYEAFVKDICGDESYHTNLFLELLEEARSSEEVAE